jgi:hypothetical protein
MLFYYKFTPWKINTRRRMPLWNQLMETVEVLRAGQGPKEAGPNSQEQQQVVISDAVHQQAPEMVFARAIIVLKCPRVLIMGCPEGPSPSLSSSKEKSSRPCVVW